MFCRALRNLNSVAIFSTLQEKKLFQLKRATSAIFLLPWKRKVSFTFETHKASADILHPLFNGRRNRDD